jgi:hypothetical protein
MSKYNYESESEEEYESESESEYAIECECSSCTNTNTVWFSGIYQCSYHLSKYSCSLCGQIGWFENGEYNMYNCNTCLKCKYPFENKTNTNIIIEEEEEEENELCGHKHCKNLGKTCGEEYILQCEYHLTRKHKSKFSLYELCLCYVGLEINNLELLKGNIPTEIYKEIQSF